MRGIQVRRDQHLRAALEPLTFLHLMRQREQRAGLAVECALRSLVPETEPFDSRHDLIEIARSGAYLWADARTVKNLGPILNEVASLWNNTLRFYSAERFIAHCRKRARSTGLKRRNAEKPAEAVCRRLYDNANAAVIECERLWLKSRLA